MKARPLIVGVGLASLAGLGAVLADERCNVRVADWQPRSAVVRMAETLGWTVQRIKTDDGCYVIQAQDRDGKEIRARVEPATLQILSTRAVRERRGHDENDDHDDGVEEALRRSDELKENPEIGISIRELDRRMKERFGWKS